MTKRAADSPSNWLNENSETDEREQNENNNNEYETSKEDHGGARKKLKLEFNMTASFTLEYDRADVESEYNENDGSSNSGRNDNVENSLQCDIENDESDSRTTDQYDVDTPPHMNESEESGSATDLDYSDSYSDSYSGSFSDSDSGQHTNESDESDNDITDQNGVISVQYNNESNKFESDIAENNGVDSQPENIESDNFEEATNNDIPNSSVEEITDPQIPPNLMMMDSDETGRTEMMCDADEEQSQA